MAREPQPSTSVERNRRLAEIRDWQGSRQGYRYHMDIEFLLDEVERLRKVCHDSAATLENVVQANRPDYFTLSGAVAALAIALRREWTGEVPE